MPSSRPISYGGEAVFDGVMMKGATAWSIAVRKADDSIHTEVHPLSGWMTKAKAVPVLRGLLALATSVALGTKSLHASMRMREGNEKDAGWIAKLLTTIGVVLVLGVFVVAPALIAHFTPYVGERAWLFSLVEAAVRLAMIVGYIAALGLNEEVREVFRYHSAEHAAISAREAGCELTPAEVAKFPNAHPRCGTAFLLLIVVTGIVIHGLVGTHDAWIIALSRVVLLPLVAGLTYELIRFASLHSHTWLGHAIAVPGIVLQRLTTRTTTERHIEVAIAALKAVVEEDARNNAAAGKGKSRMSRKLYFFEGWAIPRRILVALGLAAVVELLTLAFRVSPMFTVGFVGISWTVVPCVVALALVLQYPHRSHLAIGEPRALAYVALLVLALLFGGLYISSNGVGVTAAIFVAVGIEEGVYRLALPVVIAFVAVQLGVQQRMALLLAIVFSIALFALMPGHLSQLNDLKSYAAFAAFSLLMSHAVWRGKSLFAPIVAHAVYDFATIGMQNGDISSALRIAGAAATLLALVVIAAHPKVRVIDLREPQPATELRDSPQATSKSLDVRI